MISTAKRARPDARIFGVTVEKMAKHEATRELMIGVIADNVFGPAITFGAGGIAVEVLRDRSVGLPPLNALLAREMIGSTRVSRLLGEFRGMPAANIGAIEKVLLRVSEMVCELPWIREMDVNPLLADGNALAVDARVVIADTPPAQRPYAHLAIHPYPARLVSEWHAGDGTRMTIRPIRPEDAEIEREFVRSLSGSAKYLRFMGAVKELTPAMLARFTQIDYDREMALIATVNEGGHEIEIAVARYVTSADGRSCEFAIVVADRFQGRGLGRHLMLRLIDVARTRGLAVMTGDVLATNRHMIAFVQKLGFTVEARADDARVTRVRVVL